MSVEGKGRHTTVWAGLQGTELPQMRGWPPTLGRDRGLCVKMGGCPGVQGRGSGRMRLSVWAPLRSRQQGEVKTGRAGGGGWVINFVGWVG